jgi:hypothetical protein
MGIFPVFEGFRSRCKQLFGSSCGGNGYFAIWLKSEGYSVVDRNILPTGTSLISAACVVLWGFLSDYTGSRYLWLLIPMVSPLLAVQRPRSTSRTTH